MQSIGIVCLGALYLDLSERCDNTNAIIVVVWFAIHYFVGGLCYIRVSNTIRGQFVDMPIVIVIVAVAMILIKLINTHLQSR